MGNPFFEHPILNSPYAYPTRYWELGPTGQPTQKIIDSRRPADFVTPIPKPQRQHGQTSLDLDTETGLSGDNQQYAQAAIIRQVREQVDRWRQLPEAQRRVTPETARLLRHWRHHQFTNLRPFFCQIEAAETAVWLTEVAPEIGKAGSAILEHMANANRDANPDLLRLALKLATGAGKATVMAMLIAWQTVNALRHSGSKRFSHGFLVVTPGITIRDRLQVLAYVKNRGLGLEVPYLHGSETHTYIPDSIVQIDDGHGTDDPLNLIVAIKGYRGEDAKEKAATMRTYWVPGVNHLGTHGRWAFAEFTDVWAMQEDFAKVVEKGFDEMIGTATQPTETEITT